MMSFAACLLFGMPVKAAQDSTVIFDNAPIRVEPSRGSKVLEYLPVGSEVRISSYPLPGGWYKIRSRTGVYGWIEESHLSVNKLEPEPKQAKKEKPKLPKPERDRIFFLRGGAGLNFFRPEDVNDIFQFRELNNGFMINGEFGAFISQRIALAMRFDLLLKNVVAKENTSGVTYNLALRSYPVMGGLDFFFARLPALRLSLGLFGGAALSTSFSSEALNLGAPNVFVLEDTAFTTLARVNLTRPLGRILSLFVELGYRYLRTNEIDASTASAINGGRVFIKEGVYRPRVIDLSGVELGAGIGLHF